MGPQNIRNAKAKVMSSLPKHSAIALTPTNIFQDILAEKYTEESILEENKLKRKFIPSINKLKC